MAEYIYVVLEGIMAKNRFYTMNCKNEDPTKLKDGTVAYRVLGYANTGDKARQIIEETKQ